ncbi:MAG TPA: DUF4145 domain-containing protein [Polyangiaceae bacterium]
MPACNSMPREGHAALVPPAPGARLGLGELRQENQIVRLRALENKGVSDSVMQLLHALRIVGNRASHEGADTQEDAFTYLKIAWQLAVCRCRDEPNTNQTGSGRGAG